LGAGDRCARIDGERAAHAKRGCMMTQNRWLGLCGVVAALLVPVAIIFVAGSTPNDKASADEVMSYYRGHLNANRVAALLVTIAAVLLVLFAARLWDLLRGDRAGSAVFPVAAFGGALVTSSGLLLDAVVHFALVQASDHQFAAVAQTLNVLDNNDFFAILGGMAALLLAAGIATVMRPVLPRWLGWAAIVGGILSLAGPIGIVGFLLGLIWILVVGILMIVRQDSVAAGVPVT
jgi:hypothetical protein